MILSDREIQDRLDRGSIVIEPAIDREIQLQPASVDLRLGWTFRRLRHIDTVIEVRDGDAFVLAPQEFALGATIERISVPSDLAARVEGRSSYGRLAILVHATAGFIDPGFHGEVTLELTNLGPVAAHLHPGSRICQIVFHVMTSPAARPYGAARGSKYAGQRGPTPSRIEAGRPRPDATPREAERK